MSGKKKIKKNKKNRDAAKRMPKALYEAELERLQIELVNMQQWVTATGARVLVIFEGRDAAGKGGAIKRIVQYLNPRAARVVALPKPSERDKGQWYFQRYIERLPAAGEIVLMDRSWYNRAGVEHVLGYCTDEEYERFLVQAPVVERMLVDDGIILVKYWFSVSDDVQQARFRSRLGDPMRRWKLSETDLLSVTKWEDYSRAKDAMFAVTDTPEAPWWTIESDDKRASRLNTIRHLLSQVPYESLEPESVTIPDRPEADDYDRPPRKQQRYVPDHAQTVVNA
jgi:polyphosphate kinase 2